VALWAEMCLTAGMKSSAPRRWWFPLVGLLSLPFGLGGTPVSVGDPAPLATALDQNGESVNLAQLYARGPVLVYFYPRADTPGCTAQACNLRDHFADLQAAGVTVVGVSLDSVAAQKAFADKWELPFTLLADTERAVTTAFGVPVNGSRTARQSFLMRDGKVIWRDLSARPGRQAQEALAALANGP